MSNTEYYQVKLHLADGEIKAFSSNDTRVGLLLNVRNWTEEKMIESVDIIVMNPLPISRVYRLFDQLKYTVQEIPLRFLEIKYVRITQKFTGTPRQIDEANRSNQEKYYGPVDLEEDRLANLARGVEAALEQEYENMFLDYLSMLMQILRVCTKNLYIPRSYAAQGPSLYNFTGEMTGETNNWKYRMNSLVDAKIKIDEKLIEIQAVYQREYKILAYRQTLLLEERDSKLSTLQQEANNFSKSTNTNLRNAEQASCSIL